MNSRRKLELYYEEFAKKLIFSQSAYRMINDIEKNL